MSSTLLCVFSGLRFWVLIIVFSFSITLSSAQRQMEWLDRGVVAIPRNDGSVFISWRLFGTESYKTKFNLFRKASGGSSSFVKILSLKRATNFIDTKADLSGSNTYKVQTVVDGVKSELSKPFVLSANAPVQNYLSIPIIKPADSEVIGERYTYSANDASVGDLDGDGDYEIIVKWDPSNSKRPPQSGFTGRHILDAYKFDGTLLWRIDLGINVRAGAAYTQFLVYDFDGDGKSELVCKTADGTIDGVGNVIGDSIADWRGKDITNKKFYGKVVDGPEYLTIFNGATGAAIDSKLYIPDRYPLDGWGGTGGNGGNDNIGSRANRLSACVAYLDGVHPSVVMVRGWYGRTVETAWDFVDGELKCRWVFDSALPQWKGYSGMGNHQLSVADFDNDGKDEICIGGMVVDDDGTGLYTTGLRHGDALHVSDFDPKHPGLEVFGIHENEGKTVALKTPGSAMYDGVTGDILWQNNLGVDVGRGLAADIDPRYSGAECWGAPGGLRAASTGEVISTAVPSSVNFAIWWDGDLLRELLDKTFISKWNWKTNKTDLLFSADGVSSNNGTKSTPCLQADIIGDWREEVIWRDTNSTELRIYTTTMPTKYCFYTLMHNPQYRLSVAWQNVAYNQPPHTDFFFGHGMKMPVLPNILLVK